MEMFGYTTFTTFWQDFSIADYFGVDAIEETFLRAFDEWRSDYKYLTELVMILNWKIWYHYELGNDAYVEMYTKLWEEADEYAYENLSGSELRYFLETIDQYIDSGYKSRIRRI